MSMGFLSDEQATAYGRFDGAPSRAGLERFFFLDDIDQQLVGRRRGEHNRLGLNTLHELLQDEGRNPTVATVFMHASRLPATAKPSLCQEPWGPWTPRAPARRVRSGRQVRAEMRSPTDGRGELVVPDHWVWNVVGAIEEMTAE
jgi:hypothetical protein